MANITKVSLDAAGKQIIITQVDATTGVMDMTSGPIIIQIGALVGGLPAGPGHSMGQVISMRETVGCDPATGDPRYCMMLRSPWYVTALTSNPEY